MLLTDSASSLARGGGVIERGPSENNGGLGTDHGRTGTTQRADISRIMALGADEF